MLWPVPRLFYRLVLNDFTLASWTDTTLRRIFTPAASIFLAFTGVLATVERLATAPVMAILECFTTMCDLLLAILYIVDCTLSLLWAVGLNPPYPAFIFERFLPFTAIVTAILTDGLIRHPDQLKEQWVKVRIPGA